MFQTIYQESGYYAGLYLIVNDGQIVAYIDKFGERHEGMPTMNEIVVEAKQTYYRTYLIILASFAFIIWLTRGKRKTK